MSQPVDSVPTSPPPARPQTGYQLTKDPIFYGTVVFFAFLTSALPGLMGQPNFMPITQALGLTLLVAVTLRRDEVGNALRVTALWLITQLLVILLLGIVLPGQIEKAIAGGFALRSALTQWFYIGGGYPGSLQVVPLARLTEAAGVLLGSLVSGGLVGSWFLVRAINDFGFGLSVLSRAQPPGLGLLAGLAPWRLLTLAGYAGFFVLLSQPIITNRWRPSYYLTAQPRLITWSAALVVGGLLLGLFLPDVWRALLGG